MGFAQSRRVQRNVRASQRAAAPVPMLPCPSSPSQWPPQYSHTLTDSHTHTRTERHAGTAILHTQRLLFAPHGGCGRLQQHNTSTEERVEVALPSDAHFAKYIGKSEGEEEEEEEEEERG